MIVEVSTCDDIEVKCTSKCGRVIEVVIPKGVFVASFKRIS